MIVLALLLEQRSGEEPLLPFPASIGEVTALMVRTAVVVCGDERTLVRLDRLMVDPDALQWRADTGVRRTENGQPDPHNGARLRGRVAQQVLRSGKKINRAFVGASTAPLNEHDHEFVRARSDERALADQAIKSVRVHVPMPKRQRDLRILKPGSRLTVAQRETLAAQGLKRCAQCKTAKVLAEFYANGYCKDCGKAYAAQRYQAGYTAKSRQHRRRAA